MELKINPDHYITVGELRKLGVKVDPAVPDGDRLPRHWYPVECGNIMAMDYDAVVDLVFKRMGAKLVEEE